MSIKDSFGKESNKFVSSQDSENITDDIESKLYLDSVVEKRNTFIPRINFDKPENFARYGSAKRYYTDSIERIYNTFPYDGSKFEQQVWENSSSYIDKYILDNGYPRTTGHVILNSSYTLSATQNVSSEIFKINSDPQYITFFGGPNTTTDFGVSKNTGLKGLFGSKANKYSDTLNRKSNIDISHDLGNTVEFWFKVGATSSLSQQSTCVFDAWNSSSLDSDSYGRMMIEILGPGVEAGSVYPTTGSFSLSYLSGSTGISRLHVGASSNMPSGWSFENWHHYSFVFKSNTTTDNIDVKFYVDGQLVTNTSSGTSITNSVDKSIIGSIGAYLEGPTVNSTSSVSQGYGTLENMKVDEFRFWKKARTEKEIKRNYNRQVRGGTNTDNSNLDLGVYYKFNEGIINTSSVDINDSVILDYSGRISNGTLKNYSLACRSLDSAFANEYRDPIVRSTNSSVVEYKTKMVNAGTIHDNNNISSLKNSIPSWIVDLDTESDENSLEKLLQVMASYFDTLHLQIQSLPTLKNTNYIKLESGSFPYHFVKESVHSMGFVNPDLFVEANVLEEISSRDETRDFSKDLNDVKNSIYHNIYNNLKGIFSTKGTEKSFRNLIRCFGIDEEILKINMYSDNSVFTFNEDNYRSSTYKKSYVDFNSTSSFSSNVYQYPDASNVNSVGFIKGQNDELNFIPYTLQAEVLFPKKYTKDYREFYETPFTKMSLFGLHGANASDGSDTTWPSSDGGNFQVYFIRDNKNSPDGYFKLEFSGSTDVSLTSSHYKNVYDNEKWNIAVRITTIGSISDKPPGSSPDYQLEFYGVNSKGNAVEDEFFLTSSLTTSVAQAALNSSKRVYAGAYKTNFTGSTIEKTDVNISSVRFWNDYLDNETIQIHSFDASSEGRKKPYEAAYSINTSVTGSKGSIFVPKLDTIVLNWTFDNLTSVNSSGQAVVTDMSSGSSNSYGFIDDYRNKYHTGLISGFPANFTKAVSKRYLNNYKTSLPEILNSSDMVKVLRQDDEVFTRDTVPVKYYFNVEKSMYQTVSEEMLRVFAGIRYFNDLVGSPSNRYRMDYKQLSKMRNLFFQKVDNTPSLEKYVEFYKWIDNSVGLMLEELFPISSRYDSSVTNVVESHIFERNKYWNKFPTLDTKTHEPVASIRGINELSYDWEHGHKLLNPSGTKNILFNKERAIRTDVDFKTSDTDVDNDRESIRKAAVRIIKGNTKLVDSTETDIEFYDDTTSTSYEASTYATRRLSKPYKLNLDFSTSIKGGTNSHLNKVAPFEFVRTATGFLESKGIESTGAVVNNNSEDEAERFVKFKADSDSLNSSEPSGSVNKIKGSLINPFSEYSNTVDGTPAITNNLFDSYGKDKEVPMQGPFTETHVGGNQHRHIELNRGETLDDASSRAELYVDVDSSETSAKLYHPAHTDSSIPSARLLRDETAKRPINVRNIKYSTSSFLLGNYNKDYEILNTFGRMSQNRWFVKNEGRVAITSSTPSDAVTGLADFTLPDRTKDLVGTFGTSDHVITQRFSAPGGPETLSRRSLDAESEEFSVYNSLNYRNLTAREFLKDRVSTHSDKYGYVENTLTASFVKNQRNARKRIALSGSSTTDFIVKTSYDNYHIRHQIPRSDQQYSWVSASSNDLVYGSLSFNHHGYSSKFYNISRPTNFILSGSLEDGSGIMEMDFVGLNTTIYDPFYPNSNLVGYEENFFLSYGNKDYAHKFLADSSVTKVNKAKQLNALLLHRNGPYQHSSWKQVRNSDNKILRYNKKNNIIPFLEKRVSLNEDGTSKEVITLENYYEPVVTWNKNIEAVLEVSSSRVNQKFIAFYPHTNVTETFSNQSLKNRYEAKRNNKPLVYDKYLSKYNKRDTGLKFNSIKYTENIFPKHKNYGFSKIRDLKYYEESSDTLRKSVAKIRTFWKDNNLNRIKPNRSSNAIDYKSSIEKINSFKQLDSVWCLDNFTASFNSNTYSVLGDLAFIGYERYSDFILTDFMSHEASPGTKTFSPLGDFTSAPSIDSLVNDGFIGKSSVEKSYNSRSPALVERNITSAKQPDAAIDGQGSFSVSLASAGRANQSDFEKSTNFDDPGQGGGRIIFMPQITSGTAEDEGVEFVYVPPLTTLGGGVRPIPTDPTVPTNIIVASNDSTQPRPAIQYIYNPYHSLLKESGWRWRTSELSGKNPWYDNYAKYNEDVKKMGQNYNLLSEFNISKHMEYYVKDKKGNFTSENYGFLSLDGSGDTSSEHNSANQSISIKRRYSRDGTGVFDINVYPTSSKDYDSLSEITNNAWYSDTLTTDYLSFKNFNNTFAAGTFDIENSRITHYNITKTNPESGLSSDGNDWVAVSPFMTKNASVQLNNSNDDRDYLVTILDKINTSNSSSLSMKQENSSDKPGTPFCVSCWVNLDETTSEADYVGLWNISEDSISNTSDGQFNENAFSNQSIGLLLKSPKAGDWGGSSSSRGITFYANIGQTTIDHSRNDADVEARENVYEFFNSDGSEASLTPGQQYHILFQFVPKGTTGGNSPAYVRIFLNGQKLYGKHIKYANYDSGSSGIAYSACPLSSSAWGSDYGSEFGNSNFSNLSILQIGKSNPNVWSDNSAHWFRGHMDEFSMWYGTLTSDDATRMNYYSQPSNILEEYANSELNGTTGSWDYEFGSNAPKIGTDSSISYTIPTSSFTFKNLELFMWSRLGVPFYEDIISLNESYNSEFFDKYCHTDQIVNFNKVLNDHTDQTNANINLNNRKAKMRLKVNAIKKLLPKNGFYPAQRTTQLANLFVDSYKNSFTLVNPYQTNPDGLHYTQALQSLIQPYFAPGLLFNTIKSGLAVDFPLFTNDSGLEPSRPLPGIKMTNRLGDVETKALLTLAPSWYSNPPEDTSALVGDIEELNHETLVAPSSPTINALKNSQPKYNGNITADTEGFVIIKNPNYKLKFENLIDIETAFYNENSYQYYASEPFEENIEIFQNCILEIRGYEAENNTISIKYPEFTDNDVKVFKTFRINILSGATGLDVPVVESNFNEANIYIDFANLDEDSVTKLLRDSLIEAINSNEGIDLLAVSSKENKEPVSIDHGFEFMYPHIAKVSDMRTVSGRERIKIIYAGPRNLNYSKLAHFYDTTEVDFGDLRSTNLPLREKSLFEENLKNGFGHESRISIFDENTSKINGEIGILGIRYVDSEGLATSDSDNANFLPMQQKDRVFYGGKKVSVSENELETSLGNYKIKRRPNQVFLMTPEYYTGSIENSDWSKNHRYPYFEWNSRVTEPLYKMAMHNFLAESSKFFLKNEGMTNIISARQSKFKRMEPGKKYYMDIVMYKTRNFDMVYSPHDGLDYPGDIGKVSTHGRYFGPAFKYMNNSSYMSNEQLINDPAYAPYVPPYFYGRTTARIVYEADRENPTIDDIHRGMKIEYIEDEVLRKFVDAASNGETDDPSLAGHYGITNSPAYQSKMNMDASINFTGKTRLKNVSYSIEGENVKPRQADDSNSADNDVWVISTKFECPVLNFNPNVTNNEVSFEPGGKLEGNNYSNTHGTGMWHGYGELPEAQEGIFIQIKESYESRDQNGLEVGSLIETCGFRATTRKVGEIAEERKVSEAVIMIPFVDNPTENTIQVIDRNLFKISKDKFYEQKNRVSQGLTATPDTQETSISRMAKLMDKYYIPPKLDFVSNDSDPFVMYIFEFNHTFDQQDLADIWQGVMPELATKAEITNNGDDNEIIHDFGPQEFFEGKDMPDNIRWLTFKVKQKGEKNFFNLTLDNKDDNRFNFDFSIGADIEPKYSYNWPYDYFSIVDRINVEGGLIIEEEESEE